MSLILLADAQSRVGASITQDMLDEAEEWLAAQIGPLIGMRTETFYLSERRHTFLYVDGLWLRRPTPAVMLTSDGTSLTAGTDYRLLNGLLIERIPNSTAWGLQLIAEYEPNDEETVRSVLYDLLTFRQTSEGTQSIRIGQYSETFFQTGSTASPVLGALLRRCLPGAQMGAFADPFRYAIHRRDRTLVTGVGS